MKIHSRQKERADISAGSSYICSVRCGPSSTATCPLLASGIAARPGLQKLVYQAPIRLKSALWQGRLFEKLSANFPDSRDVPFMHTMKSNWPFHLYIMRSVRDIFQFQLNIFQKQPLLCCSSPNTVFWHCCQTWAPEVGLPDADELGAVPLGTDQQRAQHQPFY